MRFRQREGAVLLVPGPVKVGACATEAAYRGRRYYSWPSARSDAVGAMPID